MHRSVNSPPSSAFVNDSEPLGGQCKPFPHDKSLPLPFSALAFLLLVFSFLCLPSTSYHYKTL